MTSASIITLAAAVVILISGVSYVLVHKKHTREVDGPKWTDVVDDKEYWEGEDDEKLFDGLFDSICYRSDYGSAREQLNAKEQVFFVMAKLEMEVDNGGFDQFFFNTGNSWNDILVQAAEEINAHKIAEICEKALSILESGLSDDDLMERLNNECDSAFYESDEYIGGLCVEYARQNRDFFKVSRAQVLQQ